MHSADRATIRIARINDETERKEIIDLLWELTCYEDTFVRDLRLDREAAEQSLAHDIQIVADGGGAFLVAVQESKVVGFLCLVFQTNSPFVKLARTGHINDLIVAESERGKKIGECLVREAEAIARKEGLEALSVGTPYMNTRGRKFYEQLGLQPRTVRMQKPLT